MTDKHCLIYETLGKVSNLKVMEGASDGLMRLEGVFGVCGVKNQNNRVYDKDNYRQMVESLQQVIKETGCPGELEHPNSMNINLENVSHKIESIQMNEDGTITGTIVLLNTPKGQIAQAIVEGGLPLFISSRGAGTITNEGRVTLSTIKTYDLVGTPGFSQAKLNLKKNQTLECLNESLEDGNVMYAIIDEGNDADDLLGGSDDDSDEKKDKKEKKEKKDDSGNSDSDDLLGGGDDDDDSDDSDDKKDDSDEKKNDNSDDDSKDSKEDDDKKDSKKEKKESDKKDNKNTDKEDIDMKDLKAAIDSLTDKVTSLEAQLHVAQESLDETKSSIPTVNYEAIEKWVKEEFADSFKENLLSEVKAEALAEEAVVDLIEAKVNDAIELISNGVQNWVVEEFAPEVQNWVTEEFAPEVQNWLCEEFAPEVQNWVTEEFAPEVQNWVCEEFAPEVQNWVTEEFAPEVQNWITEEFAPVVDSWVNEEFAPEHMQQIEEKVNENVNAFMESHKAGRLDEIDSLLESVDAADDKSEVAKIVKEHAEENKWKGVYVVENMPAELTPSWQLLTEARQQEIVRSSRMYDFTKEGVLESFWANQDFDQHDVKQVNENVDTNNNVMNDYHKRIAAQMMHLRNANF